MGGYLSLSLTSLSMLLAAQTFKAHEGKYRFFWILSTSKASATFSVYFCCICRKHQSILLLEEVANHQHLKVFLLEGWGKFGSMDLLPLKINDMMHLFMQNGVKSCKCHRSGSISRGFRGEFRQWQIVPGIHEASPVMANQFSVKLFPRSYGVIATGF